METDETKYGKRREQWGREDPSGNARGKVGRGVPFSQAPRMCTGREAQVSAKRNVYVVVCICGLWFISWTSHSVVSSPQLGQSAY